MAGTEIRVYPALSYSAGDTYPSDECRRTRFLKTSMNIVDPENWTTG